MGKDCLVCKIVGAIVIIGALNWGLVGVLKLDLVAALLGPMTKLTRIVYCLVGLSGLLMALSCFVKACPCKKSSTESCETKQ